MPDDYFMIVAMYPNPVNPDVQGAAQVFIALGATEEDAVAKVAALDPDATLFTAQVVPTFPPPT